MFLTQHHDNWVYRCQQNICMVNEYFKLCYEDITNEWSIIVLG